MKHTPTPLGNLQELTAIKETAAQLDAARHSAKSHPLAAMQELAAIKETAAQLDAARHVVESQRAEQVAALSDSQLEVESTRSALCDRDRLIDELQGQLEATVHERDQALACVNTMQDTVRCRCLQLCWLARGHRAGARPGAGLCQHHAGHRALPLLAIDRCQSRCGGQRTCNLRCMLSKKPFTR